MHNFFWVSLRAVPETKIQVQVTYLEMIPEYTHRGSEKIISEGKAAVKEK
jgi:hypothetical protein